MNLRVLSLLAIASLALSSTVFAADAVTSDDGLTLTIKDHKFTPDTLTIAADQKVKITVINNDATSEEFESEKLGREKVIAGNSKGVVLVGPLKAGEYPFVGEFHEDTAKGKIIVK